MSHQPNHIYDFGAFRLDVTERMLMRDGEAIPLQPKAFDLLHVLVEHHGHLLEKDELLKVVWPDAIVEEVNLANNISGLRKALCEDGNGQRFIETVPRRGYRFVAGVRQIQHATVEEEPRIATPVAEPLAPTLPPAAPERSGQWRRLALALTVSGAIIIAIVAWFYFNRAPVLTEKDTILLADFENKTGEEIFDKTLKVGLAIESQQTPFLNLFPEARARHELTLMRRSPNERVTAEIALEICQRQNLKAFIAGSLSPLGSHYVITLEAVNGQNGETLANEQVQAESKEQVLGALSQAARRLRERLGESLSSIQRYDRPFHEGTTASLQAFKAYSQATESAVSGRLREAIPLYKRAIDIDPDFAHAHCQLAIMYWNTDRPELAAGYAKKAYELKERAGEIEKFRITYVYHWSATGDLNKAIESLLQQRRTYPREFAGPNDLAVNYYLLGQFEQAIPEARESIRLNPNFAGAYLNLARPLIHLNRFAEAKDVLEQALQRGLDQRMFHFLLY